MKEDNSKYFAGSLLAFSVFVAFTILVQRIDLQPTGLEDTVIGFGTFNLALTRIFPFNAFWYGLSEYLGYVALGFCLGFALLGFARLVKGKSFKAVGTDIWILAGFYVVVLAFYAIFEKIVINYRPIILDEGLEASYPSSHTVLAVCVFISSFIEIEALLTEKPVLKAVLEIACVLFTVFAVCGRFLAGVHWVTDIIGGLLLSLSLILLFISVRKSLIKS